MKICLAGEGAQGLTHIQALNKLENVEVVSLVGGIEADTRAFAEEWRIPHWSMDLESGLDQPGVEAVVLTTPNQVHADQVELALGMGKHALVEIPMGISLAESERISALEETTGLVCMVCHTKRYADSFREVQRQVRDGELTLHHVVTQTYFFRRENTNRFGKPRTWTDDLLWHQACHLIDTIYWITEDPEPEVWGQAGPDHAVLGIPMDITIGMQSGGCTVSSVLSFNHHGKNWNSYRFIGEEATLSIERNQFCDHEGNTLGFEGGGVTDQDMEFLNAIREGRKPLTSCSACLPVMRILDRIQRSIDFNRAR